MVCLVLNAPLRYGLALLHVDALVYLPKLLLFMAVLLLPLLRPRASPVAWLLTGLGLIYLLWGMVNLNTPLQALFGLWVLLPLLFGLWAGPVVSVEQWRRLFVVVFVVAAAGVFLNPLIHYPWSGQSLTLLGSRSKCHGNGPPSAWSVMPDLREHRSVPPHSCCCSA